MNKTIATITALVCMLLAVPAGAVDLGKIGKAWPIAEPDFVEDMQAIARAKVESGEWAKVEQETKRRAKERIENPAPVEGLATVSATRERRFDPSIVLSRDILDPDGRVIAAAGTVVNPLAIKPMREPVLFIDARDTRQVALAERLRGVHDDRLMVILTGGSPVELMRRWQRPVYFDQGGALSRRFTITAVPSLMTQDKQRFLISEIAP